MLDSIQLVKYLRLKAPAVWLITFPFSMIAMVGMLRMPYSLAMMGASSVFNLANMTRGSRLLAACSKIGAIILHGPHHSAQKSTTTGRVVFRTNFGKVLSFSLTGFPWKSCFPHFPHLGSLESFSFANLFVVRQLGQTMYSTWWSICLVFVKFCINNVFIGIRLGI